MSKYDQKSINIIHYELKNCNWDKAISLMKKYIVKYPNDKYIRLLYITILLKLGNKELARAIFDNTYINDSDRKEWIDLYYNCSIKLLIQEERYQECLEFLYSNENLFAFEQDYYYVEAFCHSKLGKVFYGNGYPGYNNRQIIDYDENRAIDYILNGYKYNTKGIFYPSFDIEKCYKVVKSKIAESEKFYYGFMYYEVVFQCNNCGKFLGRPSDIITVTGITNSHNIIYMHPGLNKYKLEAPDITEEVKGLKRQ